MTSQFTPARAHTERIEIAKAGGIRRWLRKRILGATALGYSIDTTDPANPKRIRYTGERTAQDGTKYVQGPDGVVRRAVPKVRQTKKTRRATRAIERKA